MVSEVEARSGDAGPAPIDQRRTAARPRSPIIEVFTLPSFRRYWFSQLGVGLVNGTLRFALVWLVLDLTDWTPAVGLVGLALGVPAMVVTLPAGALSDRLDRVKLIVVGSLVMSAALTTLAITIWTDVVTVWITAAVALVAGATFAAISPAMFAIVPSIVPPDRLMTGVGLQGMSMNIALLTGALLGGAAITLAGTGGAMAVLAAISLLAALGMSGVRLPARPPATTERRVFAETLDGMRFALGREPLRSMLAIGFIASSSWGVVQLVLPEVMRSTLGQEAFAASAVFGVMAVGMFGTTLYLSNRQRLARRGLILAIPLSGFLGTLIIVMGLSRSYVLTLVVMGMWGVMGGLSMTLQRTILQEHTPDEYMGRVMGCNAFAMAGSYPLAAGAVAASTAAFDGPGTLVLMGSIVAVVIALVVWRPAVRRI
jgi:MFS transporter, ENTS family, enterobactin (siderophore) exporter